MSQLGLSDFVIIFNDFLFSARLHRDHVLLNAKGKRKKERTEIKITTEESSGDSQWHIRKLQMILEMELITKKDKFNDQG